MRTAPLIALACGACAGGYAGHPAATPAPAPSRAVTYAPGVTRYRIASRQHVERRLGTQDQSNDAALLAYVTATLAPDSAGLQATFVVDSVPTYVTGVPGVDAARGATFSGTLAPDGTIATLAGGDSTVRLLAQLREQLQHFYPRLPAAGIGGAVEECEHRVKAEAFLERRGRSLLLGAGFDQCRVEVDEERPLGLRAGAPGALARHPAGPAERAHQLGVAADRRHGPPGCRIGGDRAEERLLLAQCGEVAEVLAT